MAETIPKPKAKRQVFEFGGWTLTAVESHILQSEGADRERFDNVLQLPQLPEMVFAENLLCLQHKDGYGIEFNALDALKRVDSKNDPLQVAVSDAWKNARANCEYIKQVLKPFDWTFTTDYKGTVFAKDEQHTINIVPTTDRIDLEKLKRREKILFYQDILLFEDELADNGTSMMNVKIRVMPSGLFILLRFFMRVDNVMIRVNDTRVYHEAGTNYILREYSSRDDKVSDIKAPTFMFTEPNEICSHLTIRTEAFEKLILPCDASANLSSLPSKTAAETASNSCHTDDQSGLR